MDANIQRALSDKLYDKRKIGALEYVGFYSPCFLHLDICFMKENQVLFLILCWTGWKESYENLSRLRTTNGYTIFLNSFATTLHMQSISLMLGMAGLLASLQPRLLSVL
jgi:hypothetical protein